MIVVDGHLTGQGGLTILFDAIANSVGCPAAAAEFRIIVVEVMQTAAAYVLHCPTLRVDSDAILQMEANCGKTDSSGRLLMFRAEASKGLHVAARSNWQSDSIVLSRCEYARELPARPLSTGEQVLIH